MNRLNRLNRRLAAAGIALAAGLPALVLAQGAAYPGRPVHIVVPTPAGGASDAVARLLAQALTATWGQQVNVENKAGASGAIAAQAVMNTPADGYTLLWGLSSMAGLPAVQKSAPYRHLNELAPVVKVVQLSYAVFATKELPVASFAELADYARAHPGGLNLATGTLGEYMVGAHVLRAAGITAQRVPYKGGAQLMSDLISGQVQLNVGPLQGGMSHARAGKLKVLATVSAQRSPLLPDVPATAELGVPAGNLPSWNGLFAPAGTPREVLETIAAAVSQALKTPAIRSALEQQGAEPLGGTPQQLAEAVESATGAWKSFVRDYAIAQE